MKQKFLLLATTLLMSVSAFAQSSVDDMTLKREQPNTVPTFAAFAPDEVMYLWNVEAKAFYAGGAEWGTRAIVNESEGWKVKFTKTKAFADELWDTASDNTYIIMNSKSGTSMKPLVADNWDGIWVDGTSSRPYYFMDVVFGENNTFTFSVNQSMVEENFTGDLDALYDYSGKNVGVRTLDNNPRLFLHDTGFNIEYEEDGVTVKSETPRIPADETFYDQWALVSTEAYDDYFAELKPVLEVIAAANSLYNTIAGAINDAPGIDLSEQIAVYNNPDATADELKAAEGTIASAVIAFNASQATPDNPVSFTAKIVNPTFDTVGDFHGWSSGFAAGGTTYTNAEVYGKTFDVYQDIEGLPAGVYIVACNGYTRYQNASADYTAWSNGQVSETKIYLQCNTYGQYFTPIKHVSEGGSYFSIGDNETTVETPNGTLYCPNTMKAADAYFHENELNDNPKRYYNEAYGVLAEGETLRIGVVNKKATGTDWSIFDDFQLLYLGNTVDAYKKWAMTVLASAPTFDWEEDGVYYGQPEREAYEGITAAVENAQTQEEIAQALASVDPAAEAITASVEAYKKYVAVVEEVDAWLLKHSSYDGQGVKEYDMLSEYIQAEELEETTYPEEYPNGVLRTIIPTFDEGFGAGVLSTEDILKEIDFLNLLKQNAICNAMVEGDDCTDLLINPAFDGNFDGWTYKEGKLGNHNVECYEQVVDVYQVVENVAPGIYGISVNAFERPAGNGQYTGEEDPSVFLYMNDFTTPVQNICTDAISDVDAIDKENCLLGNKDGAWPNDYFVAGLGWVPNSVDGAYYAFSAGRYNQTCYGIVGEDGVMKIGLTSNSKKIHWVLWANFRLTFMGKSEDALEEIIPVYVEKAEALDATAMGVSEYETLDAAITAANTAKGGEAMYTALFELVEAISAAEKSIEAYEKLEAKAKELEAAITKYADAADPDAVDAADELSGEVAPVISNKSATTAEVEAYIEKIDEAIAALKIPKVVPTDAEPVDFTDMIVNPSYEDGNDDGWTYDGSGPGRANRSDMCEYYKAKFNYYQTIKNLPAGTYEVSVNCYNRYNDSAQQDYDAFIAGKKAEVQSAFVYVKVGDETFAEPFRLISEGARADNTGTGSWSTIQAKDEYEETIDIYTPNNMQGAGFCFEETDENENPLSDAMNYVVRVVFTLTEKSDITIGVANELSTGWSIWDNWHLTAFGTESTKADSGDATAIEGVAAATAPKAIFTLSGQRVSTMTRGLYIVNGKKVLVK